MTDYLLDTNALLLLMLDSPTVAAEVRQTFSDGGRFISHVSAIEIAIKHSIGKLRLPAPFEIDFVSAFDEVARNLGAKVIGVELAHIGLLARLPLRHRDPFDRLIIAQALVEGMVLITRDRTFSAYEGLELLKI